LIQPLSLGQLAGLSLFSSCFSRGLCGAEFGHLTLERF
jgi:hypothetical protein